jgi:SHS2 domain-containing protein
MSYRFLDHTADVGADFEAPTLAALYAEALAAFTDTLTVRERVEPRLGREFTLAAADRESLLVDWLDELLYAWEVGGLLFRDAEVAIEEGAGGLRLTARARGERYDPERHPV